jgi:hypothetical protein|eukprot:SAG25_NODE_98_length_15733_cov_18.939237_14_plen_82_part_00
MVCQQLAATDGVTDKQPVVETCAVTVLDLRVRVSAPLLWSSYSELSRQHFQPIKSKAFHWGYHGIHILLQWMKRWWYGSVA